MNNQYAAPLILIVDDDWMIREILQAHLENAGYAVLTAHSGEKALEITATHTPDLVILDLRMHGISGHEVCAHLKTAPNTRNTAVLITTAMDDDETRRRAVEAGADDFLPKPFDAIVMLTRVKSLLRIKALQDTCQRHERLLWDILTRHVSPDVAHTILAELSGESQRAGL